MQVIGFDILSELKLDPEESFNWENKATSLYCIVTGNISSNVRTVLQTLAHLSRFYQGVFYVPGYLEYETSGGNLPLRTEELETLITTNIPNVVVLHQNVVIVDGIAILGANGWDDTAPKGMLLEAIHTQSRYDDIAYLHQSIKKLQKHLDVKKIMVVTNAVPRDDLYFGEKPELSNNQIPLYASMASDTEEKVSHWVFGSYDKPVDAHIEGVNYVNNPYIRKSPYWAKRIDISM